MIRRDSENGWIIFTQHDHARLAGDIMKFWGNSRFSSINPFEKVMYAVNNHDYGWIDWDALPKISNENQYPANFMEMNDEEQRRIWIKSFESSFHRQGYSSALIALHFSKLNDNSIRNGHDAGDSLEFQEKTKSIITSVFGADYTSLKDNELSREVMTNLKFLQIGDIISLALCHGWRSNVLKDVPLSYNSGTVDITLQSSDGFKYEISPNPFSKKDLSVSIYGKRLLQKTFDSDEALRSALSRSQTEKFYFTIK